MISLLITGYRFDRDLQIIQADVCLIIGGRTVMEEPLCVDVGMPALAASLNSDVDPDRWAPPGEWRTKPFFVCGCGDPECRAYPFSVRHDRERKTVLLREVEERGNGTFRVLDEWEIPSEEYRGAVGKAAAEFLRFAENLEGYRPLFLQTLDMIRAELSLAERNNR